jgi:hypothetical protein
VYNLIMLRTPTKMVLGFAGVLTLVLTYAIQRIPAPAKPVQMESKFDVADNFPAAVLKKQDRVRVIDLASTEPRPVETARVVPPGAPALAPPVLVVQEDKPARQHRRRHAEARSQDVCARHNMRKVKVGRYKWRCRKG